MMKNFTARVLPVFLVSALALSGCAQSSSTPTGSGGTGSVKSLGDVSFLYHTLEFEFMVGIENGTKEAVAKLPFGKVNILSAQGSSETQIRQFEDSIAGGVKGIVFSPNVSAELVPAVEKANAAHIPVITVDSLVAGGKIAGSVTFDNAAGGAEAAKFIAKSLNEKGKVLELTGPQGAFHAVLRHKGFIDEMSKNHSSVKVETRDAQFDAAKSLAITVDVLTKDPDYQAIFVHTDGMLRGVLAALEQVHKVPGKDILVIGLDGTPEALGYVRAGTVAATVSADPIAMGREAAQMMARVLSRQKGETTILVPPTLVTKANVDDASLWGNKK